VAATDDVPLLQQQVKRIFGMVRIKGKLTDAWINIKKLRPTQSRIEELELVMA
jgi:hypothetical protein